VRERGFAAATVGADHDKLKIAIAQRCGLADATFMVDDVEDAIELNGTMIMLDVLHYFDDSAQSHLLRVAAADSDLVIIRDAVRDGSWRYPATYAQEAFSRAVRWLKAKRLNFPTRQTITAAFGDFDADIVPMWGLMPFN